ncbi:MAG: hypothetical protein J6W54_14175 [Fibrobacter sp.]|uniref:glucuronyl esterase domain-containing protein n=1 Tax=Fibrobacter sp. TaxID=35828 RepID=UPI001B10AC96|nr:hypothetical protein [Fibrobacter sp.]MBO7062217.1 hypothetical protein [Fibrobacter sp.]
MRKRYMLPLASVLFALWACGGEDTSTAAQPQDTTEQKVVEAIRTALGRDVNLDSLKAANPGFIDSIRAVISLSENFEIEPASSSVDGGSEQAPSAQSSSDAALSSAGGTTPADPASSSSVNPASSGNAPAPASSGNAPVAGSSSSSEHSHHHGSSSSSGPAADPASSSVAPSPTSTPSTQAGSDFVEDHRSECQIGNIPSSVNNAKLPDPFMGLDGKRISSKAEWKCRREEIGAMYEKLMFGTKPRNPEKVEGSYSGGKLTIKVTDKGKSGSFSVKISNAGTKDKPKPALIGFGGGMMGGGCGSLGNSTNGLDIAMITFNPDDVAPESGGGMFFQLYNGGQGTIIAWAWGVSRIIDALEKTPDAGIDVHHLAMTGCSRWGKGTLAVGAFDERIALTIPQESGSGGASLWRVGAQVNRQKGKQFVQGLNSAGTEGKWMISSFKNYDGKENTLPFDQHMLVSMVAPRALLIIDNAGQEWLGEVPSNYCGQASLETYKALGVTENYTYSQEGGHGHCQLPNGQFDEVKDFMNKFLLGKDAKTGKIDYSKNTQTIDFKKSEWIDWDTPTLN